MASAQIYGGIAQGLAGASQELATADLRRAQVSEAKSRQQMAQQQLTEYTNSAPTRKREEEVKLQQLEAQAYTMNADSTRTQTFDAFQRFDADKDTRHLNTWLTGVKKNPVGASLYGDVVRMDPLVKSTENDQLLRKMGYADLDGVYNDPELSKDLVAITGTEQRGLVNINDLYAGTGYTNYLTNEQLTVMERKARINNAMRSGGSAAKVTLQERVAQSLIDSGKASNLADAYELLRKMESKDSKVMTSTEERMVEQLQADAERNGKSLSTLEALDLYYSTKQQGKGQTNESVFVEEYMNSNPGASYEEASREYANRGKTATQKQVVDVDTVKDELDAVNFLDKPITDYSTSEKAKLHRQISKIEDLRKIKLAPEVKRELRALRDLTALGDIAGSELSSEATGLIDRLLGSVKKYVSDEVGNTRGTSAYETFRNVFRNSLYGASLTNSEIAAFTKAAGSLNQQLNPVLSQLQVQMETVKHNMEAISDLEDPYLAHYYVGKSSDDIDSAIRAIDERINLVNGIRIQRGQKAKTKPVMPTAPKVTGEVDPNFDFDKAMKDAGL